jgi:hypothetical protein
MGYYSDVGLGIDNFWAPFVEAILGDETLNEATMVDYRDDNRTIYVWESIKWYDSTGDIDKLNKLLQYLEDTGRRLDFGYLRIGEVIGDVTELGTPDDYGLWVYQCLSY